MWRPSARAAAVLAAIGLLAGAGWLAWVLAAERVGAAVGLGPPSGVVLVEKCYDVSDDEGNSAGRDCRGQYTPAGGTAAGARPIVVRGVPRDHRAGTRLTVRLSHGVAYEPSSTPALRYGVVAGLIMVLGTVPATWFLSCARHGKLQDGSGYVAAGFAGLLGVPLLGIAVGLVAGIAEAVL
ncbi:hypothetical protein [Kitasatospora sp. NPDC088351]|uniref:hypothetical protein n=1 Tax=Kitasatospora sp. NPDC088351 TaxID=3155180 RepID=UPI003432E6C0